MRLLLALLALPCLACSAGTKDVAASFEDPRMGRVEVHGALAEARTGTRLLVLVHGLGDDMDSPVMKDAATAAIDAGWSVLRLSQRGTDQSGSGLSFAGAHEDIAAMIDSPALAAFQHIAVLGFSLGGVNALRYAASKPDARVRAVIAVSAPLDLAKTTPILDESPQGRSVLKKLVAQYRPFHDATVAKGKLQWLPKPERAAKFTSIKTFDDEITAPILKYADAAAYYAKESAVAHLANIVIPVAIVAGKDDPLVPLALVKEAMTGAPANVTLFVVDGGHIVLSPSMTMRQRGPDGLIPQALSWARAVGG